MNSRDEPMFTSKRENLPSPILEDSFFPFSSSLSSSSHRIMAPTIGPDDLLASPQDDSSPNLLEKDLILAAEMGQALLEKNVELAAQIEQMEREMEVRMWMTLVKRDGDYKGPYNNNYKF